MSVPESTSGYTVWGFARHIFVDFLGLVILLLEVFVLLGLRLRVDDPVVLPLLLDLGFLFFVEGVQVQRYYTFVQN